jgi:hypothetical protein
VAGVQYIGFKTEATTSVLIASISTWERVMAKNRYNKPAPQPVDYTPKAKKEAEVKLIFENCCVCNKPIVEGYYGRWGNGGTCSKTCERIKEPNNGYS